MMMFLFFMFFMIPMCFYCSFYLNLFYWFFLVFMFLLMYVFDFSFLYISMDLGVDLLSFFLIFLSFWICSLMILASFKVYVENNWSHLILFVILLLMISLYMTFSCLNMFMFYLFFEISLVPTLFLVIGWGYQPERLQAGFYLFFYTLLASLPMMISLFYLYNMNGSLFFYFFKDLDLSIYMYMLINSVFFVKFPMFFVHLWLPKAHVEAPISGSMILAGIMLKLGGYGMLRFMVLFQSLGSMINFVFISLSLVGGFYVSLICLRQSDMKSLIAYSSVSHMGLVLSGIMTLNYWGFGGSLVMMLAHGLCSSGLFCLANISYERTHSRSLYLNKGMINLMPVLSMFWFLLCSCNMAAPPSMNLLGEIMLINSVLSYSIYCMIFLMLISFFGAVYSLYLYTFSQHGIYYSGSMSFFSCSVREYLLLMLHWLPLNILILSGDNLVLWL